MIKELLRSIGVVISEHTRQPIAKPLPTDSLSELFKTESDRQRVKQTRWRDDDSFLR
jgi:hypothetical protein